MEVLTINDLLKLCKSEIQKGNGDKIIMLSNDDEGNGYHYLYYGFISGKEMEVDDYFLMSVNDKDTIDNTMVLG